MDEVKRRVSPPLTPYSPPVIIAGLVTAAADKGALVELDHLYLTGCFFFGLLLLGEYYYYILVEYLLLLHLINFDFILTCANHEHHHHPQPHTKAETTT